MMILDASVVLEILLRTSRSQTFEERLLNEQAELAAPHLLDVEVTQVLRRYALAGDLDETRGEEAIQDLIELPIQRYPHDLLLPRVWDLRQNFTAYDAIYVALAEALEGPLFTVDARLAKSAGRYIDVELC